jgi:hypothetical protein
MRFNLFFLILIALISSIVRSQNSSFTNVDTTYLKPSWQSNNLTTSVFQTGEEIQICRDTITWKSLNFKTNPSIVFITDNKEYYYNYSAITDERQLCPYGYRVPTIEDFLQIKSIQGPQNSYSSKNNDFNLQLSGMLDNSDGALLLLSKSNSSTFLGTMTAGHIEPTYSFSSAHLFKDGNWKVEEWPIPKNSGVSIRCISDLNEVIKDSIFEYKKLLPNEYKSLLNDLYYLVRNEDDEFIYRFGGTLNYDESEGVINQIQLREELTGSLDESEIIPLFNDRLRSFKTVPIYKGQKLKAHSKLDLVFSKDIINLKHEIFEYYTLKNSIELNSTLKSLTSHANEFGFKQFSQIEKYTIKDEGEDVITQSQKTIYKFSSRGPIYSLASVIPGLGLRLMHPNKESKYRNGGIKNALLISSISLGVVSLASKIYSNYHYKIYKNDPFAENEKFHYSRSNTAQKIFVSSGIAYCVLGAIDFTWTFTLGCKNKNIQHRLNKHLTKSPSSLILY